MPDVFKTTLPLRTAEDADPAFAGRAWSPAA